MGHVTLLPTRVARRLLWLVTRDANWAEVGSNVGSKFHREPPATAALGHARPAKDCPNWESNSGSYLTWSNT